MNNEYVIMTVIEPPFPQDPIPGEAIQLRLLDLACDRCHMRLVDWYGSKKRYLSQGDLHLDLNILQSRRAFRAPEPTPQQELFPQETVPAQPVA